MTSKNQVSHVIRISQENRDASARATHLEAANGKFLLTTNERKQMSTKTNFKRVALVAVAALGLGVLSSVPSQAAVNSLTFTVTNGTATAVKSDSTTASTIAVSGLLDEAKDTISVSFVPKAGTTAKAYLQYTDTSVSGTVVSKSLTVPGTLTKNSDSVVATTGVMALGLGSAPTSAVGYVGASFRLFLESIPTTTMTAGTYEYTVIVRSYDAGTVANTKTVTKDVTITVAAAATASKTVDAGASSVTIGNEAANIGSSLTDSTIAAAATAGTTAGVVRIRLRNVAGGNAQESITATTTLGNIGTGGSSGRSVVLAATAGDNDLTLTADGTAGTATITIKAGSVTFATKTAVFYGVTPATITAVPYSSVIGSSGYGVAAVEADSLKNDFGAGIDVYAYSSDTSVISNYGTACTYVAAAKAALCSLTGVKTGTANITVRDASTVALSTVASSAVAVKVNLNAAASVALAFDKATYAPGEKATVKITVKDSAGAILPAASYTNLFATGGITSTNALGAAASSTLLTNTSVVTMVNPVASTDSPVVTVDPIGQVSFYMPLSGGTVTVKATGGTALPAAGQVAVTATATVTDSAAAALAAVTALATTVASLKTLITTLTNLVLKIQKKVKA
jgi:hypothetical protein